MSDNIPLFYSKPTMIEAEKHAGLRIKSPGFSFAAKSNALPVTVSEFAAAALDYPIVFSGGEEPTPLVVTSLFDGRNDFVQPDGTWFSDAYVPAYVRRYPFIFVESPDQKILSLCFDDVPAVVGEGTEGEAVLNADGTPTDFIKGALQFCEAYHATAIPTAAFSRRIKSLDLLRAESIQLRLNDGRQHTCSGFFVVDETKLNALPDADILALKKDGFLALVYAHLISSANWLRFAARS